MTGRRLVAAAAAMLVAAGCGLPVGDPPTRIDPSTVPFHLLDPRSTAAPENPVGPTAHIYLVDKDRLTQVRRHVGGANVIQGAVRTLLLGPTAPEVSDGLRTAIPAETRLISLDVFNSVATVDLTKEFGALGGSDQVLAVAQIVFTLTESPRIHAVEFAVADQLVAVPDGRGSVGTGLRTRADYRSLAPR